jgi:hypothetical protein
MKVLMVLTSHDQLGNTGLGGSRGQRRPDDHRTESSFLRSGREDADGGGEAKGQAGPHGSGVVDRISAQRLG